MASKPYVTPEIRELGSVHELTLTANKIGPLADKYSGVVPIVGSITEI